jgi:hypothetical protein
LKQNKSDKLELDEGYETNVESMVSHCKEVIVRMLEYCLQRCPKDCGKKLLQRVDLLHIELELRSLNYKTPFYVDCILKYRKNRNKTYFSVNNFCNFKAISKSNISKQIYKGEK